MTDRSRPDQRRRLHTRGGFTVMEVMIASIVMLFSITSSIVVLQYGFRYLDTARKTTLAAQIMQSEMERIRMLSWTAINNLPEKEEVDFTKSFPSSTTAEKTVLDTIQRFFTAVRTTSTLSGYDDEIRQINITITWKGLDGVQHSRSSSTQYCKNGLYAYYYTGI